MRRKAFAYGILGSIALHLWLIWPARTPLVPPPVEESPPVERVAVREVDPGKLRKIQAQPGPQAAEAPPAPAREDRDPEPMLAAAAPAAPSAPPAPAPSPAAVAAAAEAVVEHTGAPAAVHADLPAREAVIEAMPPSPVASMEAQVAGFEREAARLAQAAPPAVPPAVVPPGPAPRIIPPVEFKPRSAMPAPRSPAFPWLKRSAPAVELASAATASGPAAPARSVPVPAVAPTAGVAPAVLSTPVPREPAAYRPVRFGSAGSPARRPVSAAFSQAVDRGAMAALTEVPRDPVARIAWGGADDAMRLLDLGRMMLVTVDEQLRIVGGLERSGDGWRRSGALPDLGAYSNRVRVVDHVAGFSSQAALCTPGEHLAVVVPVGLERRIERSMDEAARREGLARTQVAACYGRLVASPAGIDFTVDRVERRNGS